MRADPRKAARTGLALLMLSAGVPMITGGDEVLRTQFGNNKVYNLDSAANWLFWTRDTIERNHQTYTSRLMAFRKAHPALRPLNFYSGADNNDNVMELLRWFMPDGAQADSSYYGNCRQPCHRLALDGTAFGVSASATNVACNGWSSNVNFRLPWPDAGKPWYRVTYTATWKSVRTRWSSRAAKRSSVESRPSAACRARVAAVDRQVAFGRQLARHAICRAKDRPASAAPVRETDAGREAPLSGVGLTWW